MSMLGALSPLLHNNFQQFAELSRAVHAPNTNLTPQFGQSLSNLANGQSPTRSDLNTPNGSMATPTLVPSQLSSLTADKSELFWRNTQGDFQRQQSMDFEANAEQSTDEFERIAISTVVDTSLMLIHQQVLERFLVVLLYRDLRSHKLSDVAKRDQIRQLLTVVPLRYSAGVAGAADSEAHSTLMIQHDDGVRNTALASEFKRGNCRFGNDWIVPSLQPISHLGAQQQIKDVSPVAIPLVWRLNAHVFNESLIGAAMAIDSDHMAQAMLRQQKQISLHVKGVTRLWIQ